MQANARAHGRTAGEEIDNEINEMRSVDGRKWGGGAEGQLCAASFVQHLTAEKKTKNVTGVNASFQSGFQLVSCQLT